MFIDRLNTNQQGVLLHLAKQLISVDGEVVAEELAIIEKLEAQCSAHLTVPNEVQFSDLLTLFPANSDRVALMIELLAVAHADKEFHEEERSLINEIAQSIEMDEMLFGELNNWVQRQLHMLREVSALMEV